MRRLASICGLAAAACSSASAAHTGNAGGSTDPWAAVDTVLQNAIASAVFPGCAAAVIDPNGVVVYLRVRSA